MTPGRSRLGVGQLVALNAGLGILHCVRPQAFDEIIPDWVPGDRRFWTLASGVAEIGSAILLLNPSTRRLGGVISAGLYAAVWPANWEMARQWRGRPVAMQAIAWGRIPLQVPLLLAAADVIRGGDAVRPMDA